MTKKAGVVFACMLVSAGMGTVGVGSLVVLSGCGVNSAAALSAADNETLDGLLDSVGDASADALELTAEQVDAAQAELELREQELAEVEQDLLERQKSLAEAQQKVERQARELNELIESREPDPVQSPDVVVKNEPRYEEPVIEPIDESVEKILMVDLPASTELLIELTQVVSSETNAVGDPVSAIVTEGVFAEGLLVIPSGSRLDGSVSHISQPRKKVGGKAELDISFDRLELPSGDSIAIAASLTDVAKQGGKDAATIGGAAAGGAILGRILKDEDRDKGTVVGAVLGAAIGTAIAAKNKVKPVILEPGLTTVAVMQSPTRIAVVDGVEEAERAYSSRSLPQYPRRIN